MSSFFCSHMSLVSGLARMTLARLLTPAAHSQARGPLRQVSRIEYPTIHTPGRRVHSHSKFDVSFGLRDFPGRLKLVLEPNNDVLPPGATIKYLNEYGDEEVVEEIDRRQHKIFKGTAWVELHEDDWMHVGWARVQVHRDGVAPVLDGVFTIYHDHHHIQLGSFYQSTRHARDPDFDVGGPDSMVVFRDSDIMSAAGTLELRNAAGELSCSYDKMAFNANPNHAIFQPAKRSFESWGSASFSSLLGKRQIDGGGFPTGGNTGGVNLKSSIGSAVGCPTSSKVALVGIATDCSFRGNFNSTQSLRSNVIGIVNQASHVYESTFNVSLGLQNLTIQPESCPGTPVAATPWNLPCSSSNITDRLNSFSGWRGQHADDNAYWTLLTNCTTGPEVGLSWLGQLCVSTSQTNDGETTTGANVVAMTSTEWQVFAHETGHTFGAVHDCDSQTCADSSIVNSQQCCPLSNSTCDAGGQYIMNPSTGQGITAFSPCTVGNICSAMGRNSVQSSCLAANKDITTVSGSECGNGIVEAGEECDCGGASLCGDNNCCDGSTCKFKSGAVCDDSNEDCCTNCQFATKGAVCRASTGVCDPQEVCSGTNSSCPADATAPNGQSCGNGLQCASGQCTSRDLQCKTLMGSYTSDNDTYACDSQDCTLTCASPQFGPNTCYSMQQNFLDGTPCGGTGQCSNVSPLWCFIFPPAHSDNLPGPVRRRLCRRRGLPVGRQQQALGDWPVCRPRQLAPARHPRLHRPPLPPPAPCQQEHCCRTHDAAASAGLEQPTPSTLGPGPADAAI